MADTFDQYGTDYSYDGSGVPVRAAGDAGTPTLGSYLGAIGGATNTVLGYLSASNQASAQKKIAALNASAAASRNKTSLSLAHISQRTWLIAGGALVAVVLLVVLFRRK